MSNYARRVAALEQHAAFIETEMADLLREGEALVDLHHALGLAFKERVGREFIERSDEFSIEDEARAEQLLLEMFPRSEA